MIANAKLVITDLTWNAVDQPKPGTPITISGAETWPLEVAYLNVWQK